MSISLLLFSEDPHIIALANDCAVHTQLPQLNINYPEYVADFIQPHFDA